MTGKTVAALHLKVSGGVTVKLEATNTSAADLSGSAITATWVDITKFATDLKTGASSNTSWVDTSTIAQINGICVERLRVKSTTSDATNVVRFILRTI
jgi:hypothetical protein